MVRRCRLTLLQLSLLPLLHKQRLILLGTMELFTLPSTEQLLMLEVRIVMREALNGDTALEFIHTKHRNLAPSVQVYSTHIGMFLRIRYTLELGRIILLGGLMVASCRLKLLRLTLLQLRHRQQLMLLLMMELFMLPSTEQLLMLEVVIV